MIRVMTSWRDCKEHFKNKVSFERNETWKEKVLKCRGKSGHTKSDLITRREAGLGKNRNLKKTIHLEFQILQKYQSFL